LSEGLLEQGISNLTRVKFMMDCVEDALQFTNDVVRNCRTKGVRVSNFVNFGERTLKLLRSKIEY